MDTISYDDFLKVELVVGTITKAEAVPKSEKLLKLEVYFGETVGYRVIMAGIAKDFKPEYITGFQVVGVLNLAPRKMMGVESHGMLLAGHNAETGLLSMVQCLGVPAGTRLG
jgi:methionyl-tRNA synthetase